MAKDGEVIERPEDAMSIAAFEAELDRPYDEAQVAPV